MMGLQGNTLYLIQIAPRVWIVIENKKWAPTFDYPSLEIVRLSTPAFTFGVEAHAVDCNNVKIYNQVKTVYEKRSFKMLWSPDGPWKQPING